MIVKISRHLKEMLHQFNEDDPLVFNNKLIRIDTHNFHPIPPVAEPKTITFIDGGQAEILSAGNFCVSFIRVFAQVFQGMEKKNSYQNEFYLLTTARWQEGDIFYDNTLFPLSEKLFNEKDLLLSSNDSTIRNGLERAPIARIASMARRFAELQVAANTDTDFVIIDGTLEKTYRNEEKFLAQLPEKVSALAKTSSLFTVSGNSPVVLLNQMGEERCWHYHLGGKTYFVRLHPHAKHVFRFEGNPDVLSGLVVHSQDALFVGYPYGLLFVDRMARVSNQEKKSLMMNFLVRKDNREILQYLTTANAHGILDSIA